MHVNDILKVSPVASEPCADCHIKYTKKKKKCKASGRGLAVGGMINQLCVWAHTICLAFDGSLSVSTIDMGNTPAAAASFY